MTYEELLKLAKKHNINLDEDRLKRVYEFAAAAHEGQIRHSGEPYISHPLATAANLITWGQSQPVIEAGLLHDVIEDTKITLEDIKKNFDDEVAFLVDGVTKVGKVKLRHSTDNIFVENLRKMFVAMAQDIRVIIIRLADRLHNMQTLSSIPISKQKRIAQETLEIYAPLAERLGMGKIKGNLEDLAFPYLYPEDHDWVCSLADSHLSQAEDLTKKTLKYIKKILIANKITADIHGRHKRKYSLFKKLQRPEINQDLSKVNDLIAIRIITDKKADCYAALGAIHQHFKPAPHLGVSDFIAQPKPNGYQSIHTKVFNHRGHIVEIQIRTKEMHEQAEFGAAAHYAYSEAKRHGASGDILESGKAFNIDEKMDWVKQLAAWQQEMVDSEEYIKSLKLDALSHRIYVFSPLGDVYDLPQNATPVDFAFAIHTDLINYLQSAIVNKKIVPLDYPLQNGDVVEIIKQKTRRRPNSDWQKSVKTSAARARIRRILKHSNPSA